MSLHLSIYAGLHQPKPEIIINTSGDSHWLEFRYDGKPALVFHGRSLAQCQSLADAWNAMWDEPAEDRPGLPDRIVKPDPDPTYQEEREEREERDREDGGLADELDSYEAAHNDAINQEQTK